MMTTTRPIPVAGFQRSIAVMIGINDYRNGIPPLATPVDDARQLAQCLADDHGYETYLLVEDVTRQGLTIFFTQTLVQEITRADRLLVYFAGHGIALDGDDGPQGYLILQDARAEERSTFLPMTEFHGWLDALDCRHLLAILDCCFAGAFRWAGTRHLQPLPDRIYKERYDRFIRDSAWQVLTSAAYDQKALDILAGQVVGERGVSGADGQRHSPFALALLAALAGAGDLIPKGQGDGVMTATELYLYLREFVEVQAHRQTPGLWPLRKHDKGEYIFLVPGHDLNLPPAPPLTTANNPYRGLKSYEEEDADLFFGRSALIEKLAATVQEQQLTVVLGASGTGKSSLVKAGLLPYLRSTVDYTATIPLKGKANPTWQLLPPLRPGEAPLAALLQTVNKLPAVADVGESSVRAAVETWLSAYPSQRLLLVIDQFEEVVTLCHDDTQREQFQRLLADLLDQYPDRVRLVLTLRTDFESQFTDSPLTTRHTPARFIVPPMSQAELRTVIEGPAVARVLFFDPSSLVDALIDEVIQTPGALPLLSFALEQLYLKYLKRQAAAQQRGDTLERALTWADYSELGGVIGSLRTRADEEYNHLLDDAHRLTMQRVLLRMIAVEGGEVARRRVPLTELVYPNDEENGRVHTVIDRLVTARLVVRDRADLDGDAAGDVYIEPAHDALVRAWDRLRTWQVAAEQELPLALQRTLTQAANEWQRATQAQKRGLLWNNSPWLSQLKAEIQPALEQQVDTLAYWLDPGLFFRTAGEVRSAPTRFNQQESEFIVRSVERRTFLWQRLVGITLAVMVALASIATFAELQRRAAVDNEKLALQREAEANREATVARANLLTTVGNAVFEAMPLTGLRLASEGLATIPRDHVSLPQIESAVRQLLKQGRLYKLGQNDLQQLYQSPSGNVLILDHDRDDVPDELLRLDTTVPLTIAAGPITAVAYDPTEAYVIVTYFWPSEIEPHTLQELRRTDNGALLLKADDYSFDDDTTVFAFAPSPNWDYFVVNTDYAEAKIIRRIDMSTVVTLPERLDTSTFNPQADQLRVAYFDSEKDVDVVALYDLATGQHTLLPPAVGEEFSPDGRYLVAAPAVSAEALYDLQTQQFISLTGNSGQVTALQFITQTTYFTVAFEDGHVELYNVITAQPSPLSSALGTVERIEFSPKRTYFVVTYQHQERNSDQTIELRQTDTGAVVELPTDAEGNSIDQIEFSPQESFLQVSYPASEIQVLRSDTGESIYGPIEFFVNFSPDDSHFVGRENGSHWVVRVDTGQHLSLDGVIRRVEFSQKGKFFRTWDEEFQMQFLRSADDKPLPVGNFADVMYSPSETYFVMTYATGSSYLWDGEKAVILAELGQRIAHMQFDVARDWLLIAYEDGRGYIIDLAWLTALQEKNEPLSIDELVQFACNQLSDHAVDTSIINDYLDRSVLQACS